jgi:hypothetical protein
MLRPLVGHSDKTFEMGVPEGLRSRLTTALMQRLECRGLYPERSGGRYSICAEMFGPERFGYKALN